MDCDNGGIGDIKGTLSELAYIKDLGRAIWAKSAYKTIDAEKEKYPYIYERTDGKERSRYSY